MASISSIISLFVVVLATCCYSVPIGTEFEFTTMNWELTTEKSIVQRELSPFTSSYEETTGDSRFHSRGIHGVGNDHSIESDEQTTEVPMSSTGKIPKRTFAGETQSWNDVVTDGSENIKVREHPQEKREEEQSPERREEEQSRERREEEQSPERREEQFPERREVEQSPERREEQFPERREVEVEAHSPYKRENEQVILDITTSNIPTEGLQVERTFGTDFVSTVESSTDFNSRANRHWESESDVPAFTEPTSSVESLAHSTGLINRRNYQEGHGHEHHHEHGHGHGGSYKHQQGYEVGQGYEGSSA